MRLDGPVRIMPAELGAFAEAEDHNERCNRWLLDTALALGGERLNFICLWNEVRGNGLGGTNHMHEAVKRRTEGIEWVDSRML